ncbi:MAG: hypothetical protein KDB33_14095, partial [Acidimicrobiales bacterium]|nr:hypothetical protein [Acidimicrobiales bacterium]
SRTPARTSSSTNVAQKVAVTSAGVGTGSAYAAMPPAPAGRHRSAGARRRHARRGATAPLPVGDVARR